MSKIDLDPITSGYNLSKINANFQKVEDELNNKVLYRNPPAGEPNSMSSNLDMNSRPILNVSKISSNILELGGVQVVPTNLAIDPYNGTREALRRSYAEAGYTLVAGSFEAGGTITTATDVLLHEGSGKAYSGAGPFQQTVPAGTSPASGGFTISEIVQSTVPNYAGLRAYTGLATTVYVTGVIGTAKPDGIAGYFARDPNDTTSADNGVTIIVGVDGRRWVRCYTGEVQAEWAGVSPANTDNASAIMAALSAAGSSPVRLPAGVINSGKITFNSFNALLGHGSEATTLRLKNASNTDLLYAANSDDLWGTNSTVCVVAPRIEGMTLDGNRTNNTAGRCLAMYAERPILHDVVITGGADDGLRTEWSSTASESQDGLEGRFTKLTIMRNGGHGWRFAGPHDSHVDDVIIFSNSLKQDRTYQNLWIEKGNARWGKIHSYSTADILPKRVQHSLLISAAASGNEFSMSHFEGGATNVRIIGNNNIFDDSCRYYYPWDGINVALAGNGNIVRGFCGEEYTGIGLPRARGVVFSGDSGGATGNRVDVTGSGCGGGLIDFGGSSGSNWVKAVGYNPLSTDVGYAATPHASDEVDLFVRGGITNSIRQTFGYYNRQVADIAAAGTTQSDATQMTAGVGIFNLSSGATSSGIKLPNATTAGNGAELVVANTTANTMKIYPNTGGNIAGLGLNNPLSLAGLKTARFVVIDSASGQWAVMVG